MPHLSCTFDCSPYNYSSVLLFFFFEGNICQLSSTEESLSKALDVRFDTPISRISYAYYGLIHVILYSSNWKQYTIYENYLPERIFLEHLLKTYLRCYHILGQLYSKACKYVHNHLYKYNCIEFCNYFRGNTSRHSICSRY